MEDKTISSNSFCTNCGAPIEPGARFCDNCGTPVRTRPGRNTGWDANQDRNRNAGWDQSQSWNIREGGADDVWDRGQTSDPDQEKSSTLKWTLIGVGIGLAVLLLIFGTIHFLKAADDEKENSRNATTEQAEETETEAPDYDDSDDSDDYGSYDERQSGWDENNDTVNYASYATEEELYDPGTPVFFPDSSERYLGDEEVLGMNGDQLQKAVNDIYARNGKLFKTRLFQVYYDSQTWYYGFTRDDDEIQAGMNNYEKKNVDLLRKRQ